MTNPSSEFKLYAFENVKKQVKKKFASLKDTIKRKERFLKTHPYDPSVSEPLGHDLVGLRTVKIKKNFLMLIAICEECRLQNMQEFNNCEGCENITDKSVVIFEIAPHDDLYSLAKKYRARKQMPS
ncbi:hypothetical protein KAX21_00780 [candidate division WOR-3 bacterium]|nr:hypothetical protein [candidate division WOR-3 bacterium]